MARYKIVITVKADSLADAEYMAKDMLGAAYDSVVSWSVKEPKRPAEAVR